MDNFQQQNDIPNANNQVDVISKDNSTVSLDPQKILEWGLYVVGVTLIIVSLNYLLQDLDLQSSGDVYEFKHKTYVGGDAYNLIISAARSGAVMTKSLIFAVLGCSSIIIGGLTAIMRKMK